MPQEEKQLGDFIKGRLLFIEEYCRDNGLDPSTTRDRIFEEAVRIAGSPERAQFLSDRLFRSAILSTSFFPDWVDKVLLEAMTHILKGQDAPLWTNSSERPCIPFEAGRFNAMRQARSVFKLLFEGKSPDRWLEHTFRILYKKCYGDAARGMKVERREDRRYRIILAHKHLTKATPMDCSTIIGYLYGSLESLGAGSIVVEHTSCATGSESNAAACIFEIQWGKP